MTPEENDEISSLKNQVFTLLIALIVISGTLTVYLYRQASIAGKEKQQAILLGTTLNEKEAAINNFITQVVAYGEKNPDFTKQVLSKYGIAPVAGVPANAPAGTAPKK